MNRDTNPESDLLPAAVDLWGRGFSIFPLEWRAKTPAVPSWKPYQDRLPTPDEVHGWFSAGTRRNIAIVTGAVSEIVVIDTDSADADAWARRHLPDTPMRVRTARGEHRYYRHPGSAVRNRARLRTADPQVVIDVRADGGYVVGPGSLHASGAVYERVGAWPSIRDLPMFDVAWLAPDDGALVATPPDPAPVPAPSNRDRVLRRARAYLEATPPAVEGQGGDDHTYRLCCKLVLGFDLSDADALELLAAWNARCVPPWTDEALRAKVTSARKYGTEPIAGRRQDRTSAPAPVRVFNLTDTGNAESFAARFGQDVRFDHRRGRWLIWREHRWQPDADAEVRRLMKAAMRGRFQDASTLDDVDARARLAKWAIASEARSRIEGALFLAQAERPIADADDWDTDPWLLGVPNGVVDLRDGSLRPGRREDRITLCTSVPYDPAARSDRWHAALRAILVDDDAIAFFHAAAGYSATGDTRRDCWFLAHGSGRNGKGTLLQAIARALGDYAVELPAAIFALSHEHGTPYDLAALPGRRFVSSSETGDSLRLHHDRIKQITGGDRIRAAAKYERSFEFAPVCKLWLSCNRLPRTSDDSAAFWARIVPLPFRQSFVGREDRDLRPALTLERAHQAAILAWLVTGAGQYFRAGLPPLPVSVEDATAAYREESDPLAAFLADAIDIDPGSEIRAGELYAHYEQWAKGQGLEPLKPTGFGRRVGERFKSERRQAGKVYLGLARRLP